MNDDDAHTGDERIAGQDPTVVTHADGTPALTSDQQYDAAVSMIDKLRLFANEHLSDLEREALYALLVPGVASAFHEEDVEGHVTTEWTGEALPQWLVRALETEHVRLVGLNPDA